MTNTTDNTNNVNVRYAVWRDDVADTPFLVFDHSQGLVLDESGAMIDIADIYFVTLSEYADYISSIDKEQ